MKLSRNVRDMTYGERGREILRLRRAIKRFVRLQNNAKCHLEDDRLAHTIGLAKSARSIINAKEMIEKCFRYVGRECRAGRIHGDLTQVRLVCNV